MRNSWLAVGGVAILALLVASVVLLPSWLVDLDLAGKQITTVELLEAKNRARGTLLQALGGIFFIATAFFSWRQLLATKEGQITERYTRAIEQLGSGTTDVQVGGLFALGRIARDSGPDRQTVTVVVAQHARHASPWSKSPEQTRLDPEPRVRRLRDRKAEAQAAIDVLTKMVPSFDASPGQRVNLTFMDLRHSNIGGVRFPIPPDFEGSNLAGAFLDNADLRGARLNHATLADTALAEVDLRGAEILHAYISANLKDTKFSGARLHGSDFRDATNIESANFKGALADKRTLWPASFDPSSAGIQLEP